MALVKFILTDAASFAAAAKDDATLYFVQDERRLYKGSVPYSGGIYTAVSSFPELDAAAVNTLYIHTSTGEVRYFNGTAYQTVVKPYATSITGAGDNNTGVTSKALVDYVATKIADLDVSALAARVTTAEGKLDVIQGTGDGSITKAASDAQDAATAAAKTYTDAQVDTLNTAIGEKADKATTLAGYGIDDAYTKAQTDAAITTAVAQADHLKRAIVDALPEVSAADEHTIYMVSTGGTGEQRYEEFMLINGAFEKIGDSAVDLTDYATKAYVDTAKADAVATAAADATTKANAAKSEAISTAAADATSKADAAQAAAATDATTKADAALASAKAYTDTEVDKVEALIPDVSSFLTATDITTGAANGTIAVEGTDVPVKGLGSAAFVATTAFDAAGAATNALDSAKTYADSLAVNYATAAQGTKADEVYESLTWGEL